MAGRALRTLAIGVGARRAARRASALVLACAMASALASGFATRVAAAVELTDLAAEVRRSVVLVTLYDEADHPLGTGSGFFVSADGRVVTNVHVIEGGARATLTTEAGKVLDVVGVLAADEANDVALLKVDGDGYPPLTLGDSHTLKTGEQVAVVGSPRGLAGSFSVGVVSAIRERGVGEDAGDEGALAAQAMGRSWAVQITAPISPGSSGSPVLRTSDGTVVAVAVGQVANAQNLNFAVPIDVARALVDRVSPGAKPSPLAARQSAHVVRNLAISVGVFAAFGALGALVSRKPKRKTRARFTPPPS